MRYVVDQNISSSSSAAQFITPCSSTSPPARPAEGPSQGHVGRPVGADQVSDAMATDFTSGLRYGAGLAVGAQNWRSTMILWKQNVSMTGCRAAASAIDDVVK